VTRRLLPTDGRSVEIEGRLTMALIGALIGADCLDTVNLRNGDVLVVDDLGHSKCLPINDAATQLYLSVCKPNTTHQIRGDAVVIPDADFA
jgi:hypothetical protein